MASKKNPAPVLACVISGQSRKTSHNYLNDKAKRLGVSSEWLLNNYVSKYVCSQLRAGRSLSDLKNTDSVISDEQLKELVQKNSKSRVTNFWFEGGVYNTAKPTPKKREETPVTIDDVVSKAEKKLEVKPEPPVKAATFDEALAELQEVEA
jgi:hypothetical protein